VLVRVPNGVGETCGVLVGMDVAVPIAVGVLAGVCAGIEVGVRVGIFVEGSAAVLIRVLVDVNVTSLTTLNTLGAANTPPAMKATNAPMTISIRNKRFDLRKNRVHSQ